MIAGIDIGTSYSSICVLDEAGKIQPVEIATGTSMYGSKYSLPSAVFVNDDGSILVGQAAMNNRRNKPEQFCMEFKRSIGQEVPIFLGDKSFFPEDLYKELFIHMQTCVKRIYNVNITKARITCPAAFSRRQREKIVSAAKSSGLFDVEIIDEPTAAACCYLDMGILKDGQNILLYDFGGGTFDVSLLNYAHGHFTHLAEPAGLEQCGGIDLDRLIYQDIVSNIDPGLMEQIQKNKLYKMRFQCQLELLAVKIKHQLSSTNQCEEFISVGWENILYRLRKEQFDAMAAPIISQTIDTCRQVLKNSGCEVKDLSAIFCVGGTSRIPLVSSMIRNYFKDVPVYRVADLELAVAAGALKAGVVDVGRKYAADKNINNKNRDNHEEVNKWFELGMKYYYGNGVQANIQKAEVYFRKASILGHMNAQEYLAKCYYKTQDYEAALKWLRIAEKQESTTAWCMLGYCYAHGKGVQQDDAKALEYYNKVMDKEMMLYK